jgi:phage protein U
MSLDAAYKLPELGSGRSQWLGEVGRTISIDGVLLGASRFAYKAALEALADVSMLFAARFAIPLLTGVPVVSGLVVLTDMQITGLKFSQNSQDRGVVTVHIDLKHCPKGFVAGLIGRGLNMAGSLAGFAVAASGVRAPLVGGAV